MFDLYECPDCHRSHDEPAEAAYVLAVRCLDCVLEAHMRRDDVVRELAPAA